MGNYRKPRKPRAPRRSRNNGYGGPLLPRTDMEALALAGSKTLAFFPVNVQSVRAAAQFYLLEGEAHAYRDEVERLAHQVEDIISSPLLDPRGGGVNEEAVLQVVDLVRQLANEADPEALALAEAVYPRIGLWDEYEKAQAAADFGLLGNDRLLPSMLRPVAESVLLLDQRMKKAHHQVTVRQALMRPKGTWQDVLPVVAFGQAAHGSITGAFLATGTGDSDLDLMPIEGGFLFDRPVAAIMYSALAAGLWDFAQQRWADGASVRFALPEAYIQNNSDKTGSLLFANYVCSPGRIYRSESGRSELSMTFNKSGTKYEGLLTQDGQSISISGVWSSENRAYTLSGSGLRGQVKISDEQAEIMLTSGEVIDEGLLFHTPFRQCPSSEFLTALKAQASQFLAQVSADPLSFLPFVLQSLKAAGSSDLAQRLSTARHRAHLGYRYAEALPAIREMIHDLRASSTHATERPWEIGPDRIGIALGESLFRQMFRRVLQAVNGKTMFGTNDPQEKRVLGSDPKRPFFLVGRSGNGSVPTGLVLTYAGEENGVASYSLRFDDPERDRLSGEELLGLLRGADKAYLQFIDASKSYEMELASGVTALLRGFAEGLDSFPIGPFIGEIEGEDGINRLMPAVPDPERPDLATWYGTLGGPRFVALTRLGYRRGLSGEHRGTPPSLFLLDFLARTAAPPLSERTPWADLRRKEVAKYSPLVRQINAADRYTGQELLAHAGDVRGQHELEDRAWREAKKGSGWRPPVSIPIGMAGTDSANRALQSVVFTVYGYIDPVVREYLTFRDGPESPYLAANPEKTYPTYGIIWQSTALSRREIDQIIQAARQAHREPPAAEELKEVLPILFPATSEMIEQVEDEGGSVTVLTAISTAGKIGLKPGQTGSFSSRGRTVLVRFRGPRTVEGLEEEGVSPDRLSFIATDKQRQKWLAGRSQLYAFDLAADKEDFPPFSLTPFVFNPAFALRRWVVEQSGLMDLAALWHERESGDKKEKLPLPFSIVGSMVVDRAALANSQEAARFPKASPIGRTGAGLLITSLKIPTMVRSNIPEPASLLQVWSHIDQTTGLYPHTIPEADAIPLSENLVQVGVQKQGKQIPLIGTPWMNSPLFTFENVRTTPRFATLMRKKIEEMGGAPPAEERALVELQVFYKTIETSISSSPAGAIPALVRGSRRAFAGFGGEQGRIRRVSGASSPRYFSPSPQEKVWGTEKQSVYVNIVAFASQVCKSSGACSSIGVRRVQSGAVALVGDEGAKVVELMLRYDIPIPDPKDKEAMLHALERLRDSLKVEHEQRVSVGILPHQVEEAAEMQEDLASAFAEIPEFAAALSTGEADPMFSHLYLEQMAKLNGRKARRPRKARRSRRNPLKPEVIDEAVQFLEKGKGGEDLDRAFSQLRRESPPDTWPITKERLGQLFPRAGQQRPDTWAAEKRLTSLSDFDMVSRVRHQSVDEWARERSLAPGTLKRELLDAQIPFGTDEAAAYIAQRANLSLEEAARILGQQREARRRPFTMQASSAVCKGLRRRKLKNYDLPAEVAQIVGNKAVILWMSPVGVFPPRVMTFRRGDHIDCDLVGRKAEDLPDLLGTAIQSALYWVGENPRRRAASTTIFVGRAGDPYLYTLWLPGEPLTTQQVAQNMAHSRRDEPGYRLELYSPSDTRNRKEVERYMEAARALLGPDAASMRQQEAREPLPPEGGPTPVSQSVSRPMGVAESLPGPDQVVDENELAWPDEDDGFSF